jgi:hypothetical protein
MLLFSAAFSSEAKAQTPSFQPPGRVLLSTYGEASNVDAGGGLAARVSLPQGFQLGGSANVDSVRKLYLSGYETSGSAVEGRLFALSEFGVTAPLSLSLQLGSGWRHLIASEDTPAGDSADRVVSDVSIKGHFRIHPRAVLRAGWTILVDLQVAPDVTVASLGGLLDMGGTFAFSNRFSIFADIQTGGTYGFDGNNEKYLLTGRLGFSVALGSGGQPWLVY